MPLALTRSHLQGRSPAAAGLAAVFVTALLHAAAAQSRAEDTGDHRLVVVPDAHGDVDTLRDALALAGIPGPPKAASTTLVSLGDLFDRGPFGEECHDLLMKVARDGDAAGVNRTVRLFGNHEWLNLLGVDERDNPSTRHQENLFAPYVHEEELRHFGGWQGRRKALSREGPLGRELRSNLRLAAQVPPPEEGGCADGQPPPLGAASTLLIHAGISWETARAFKSVEALAERAAADVAGEAKGKLEASELFSELTQDRSLAGRETKAVCRTVEKVLGRFCAARLVLGHTPNFRTRRALIRCGGRLVLLDVAMSRWLGDMDRPEKSGRPAALEIRHRQGRVLSAVVKYGDGTEDVVPAGSPRDDL